MNELLVFARRRAVLALCLFVAGCGGGGGPEGGPPAVGVSVAEVMTRPIVEWDEFTGRIQAVNTVQLQPRITGYLDAVHFAEGAVVEQGDLLFTIDDREYRAAVASQRADVVRAETRVELAQQDLDRSEKLVAAKAVSIEELEQRRGEVKQAQADLNSARAALDSAELNLEFTRVTAPIAGRVGEALIRPGNLVTPNGSVLTTLVSIDPIHVVFEGDERIYLKYQARAASGERPSSRDVPNPVQVGLASDADFPFRGHMDFVDNQVDPATGTIQGRALIDNPDGYLIPGLFARVRLLGSNEYDALMIHEAAVMTDQDRKYVYVVTPDNAAVRRDVELGREADGLRVVSSGLEAGERIVVNGVRKVFFSGAPVIPTIVPMNDPTQTAQAPSSTPEG
ncbi:MAG: efflux RND transporter periplasmic adaptor subunit [Woeseiaceae bacterium]|nr:efflux RND transporter periplasmic adaptor subunit [Woeseiaceae bacterium]